MAPGSLHRYFRMYDDDIETGEIFGPVRAAHSDDEVAAIVAAMNWEGKSIFGNGFSLRFDRCNLSKDVAARIWLRMPAELASSATRAAQSAPSTGAL